MKKRVFIVGLTLFAVCFLFTSFAAAATWYTGIVTEIVQRSNTSDAVLKIWPGTGEQNFSGLVRVKLNGTNPGSKQILALILTAISMGKEITFSVDGLPSYDVQLDIISVGMTAD